MANERKKDRRMLRTRQREERASRNSFKRTNNVGENVNNLNDYFQQAKNSRESKKLFGFENVGKITLLSSIVVVPSIILLIIIYGIFGFNVFVFFPILLINLAYVSYLFYSHGTFDELGHTNLERKKITKLSSETIYFKGKVVYPEEVHFIYPENFRLHSPRKELSNLIECVYQNKKNVKRTTEGDD